LANTKKQGGKTLTDLISDFDRILGLDLISNIDTPQNIIDLAEKRLTAKKAGEYEVADDLRAQISDLDYTIEDTSTGYRIVKN
jgi:cysteinyl-tRNA synthetase